MNIFNQKRVDDFKYAAHSLDMEYSRRDDFGIYELLADFNLFGKGRKKRISNILTKTDPFLNNKIMIFDYYYLRGKNKRRNLRRQTVFFLQAKSLALPQFLMKPETFFHKLGEFFGLQDIDFEEYPEFSRQYRLTSEDEEYLRSKMDDTVLRYFTANKKWNLEGIGFYLIFYKQNKLFDRNDLIKLYKKGLVVFQLFEEKTNKFI